MTKEAISHLTNADRILGRLIAKVGPCTLVPKTRRTPFESLVRSVVFQQLNGTAASAILARVTKLYPHRRFPKPQDLLDTSDAVLRSAGLSRAKIAAIKDISAKSLTGVVPSSREIAQMANQEILDRLTSLRGVGPWTVEMLLIFTLGRPDVLPSTDYGVRKGFALTYGWKELPTPKELLEFSHKWSPYRSTAAWYFWRALD